MPTSDVRLRPWDIVVLPFPYTDRLAEKRRPALIVSSERLSPFRLLWVAMITSADNPAWPADVSIDDWRHAGLTAPSRVRPAKVACIDSGLVLDRAGRLDRATARHVLQELQALLAAA
jgi:mRNA interferase MazF